MSLEKVSDILKNADKRGTAVLAFDTYNYESIAWLIDAAEELQIPVIQMLHPFLKSYTPFGAYAEMVKALAARVKVPVGLHLDHCRDYDEITEAMNVGFTSVMIDGSSLPYEENVKITSRVVKAAHAQGIDVEAELGLVGFAKNVEDYQKTDRFTKPEEAKDFIEKTGVDSLAIAFGSAHGVYIAEPKLDLERLKLINAITDTPLVLHGGSGIPDDQLKQAFKLGINKLNVGTEVFNLFSDKTIELLKSDAFKNNYAGYLFSFKDAVLDYYRNKISIVLI